MQSEYEHLDPAIRDYLHAVDRRLRLPRKVKKQILHDIADEFHTRLEAGESPDAIVKSMDKPSKAVAKFHAEKKELVYRRSHWRFAFLGGTLVGIGGILYVAVLQLMQLFLRLKWALFPDSASSVGIIGGADGPTAIFVTAGSSPLWFFLGFLLLTLVGLVGFYWMGHLKPLPPEAPEEKEKK